MTTNAWVGIDVACAKGKYLPIAICTRQSGRLVPLKLKELSDLAPPRGMGNALVIEPSITREFAINAVRYVHAVAERPVFQCRTGFASRRCQSAGLSAGAKNLGIGFTHSAV